MQNAVSQMGVSETEALRNSVECGPIVRGTVLCYGSFFIPAIARYHLNLLNRICSSRMPQRQIYVSLWLSRADDALCKAVFRGTLMEVLAIIRKKLEKAKCLNVSAAPSAA